MMRRVVLLMMGMVFGISLISCGQKRYVGERVDYSAPYWCGYSEYIYNGEKRCILDVSGVIFDFLIKSESEDTWLIEGTIDLSRGDLKSADHIDEARTRFFMLVAKDGCIIDNVVFRPRFIGNIGQNASFKFRYTMDGGFSAITFGYNLTVKG